MTAPSILTVPWEHPEQSKLYIGNDLSPYAASWFTWQYIEEIPEESIGWLVAQGWQVTDVEWDKTTRPWTARYDMSRKSLLHWNILQSLLNSYTLAKNTAKWAKLQRTKQ